MRPCPHCGELGGFYVTGQWMGPAEMHFNPNGQHTDTTTDRLYCKTREVVRCGACSKIRRDVKLEHFEVVEI